MVRYICSDETTKYIDIDSGLDDLLLISDCTFTKDDEDWIGLKRDAVAALVGR